MNSPARNRIGKIIQRLPDQSSDRFSRLGACCASPVAFRRMKSWPLTGHTSGSGRSCSTNIDCAVCAECSRRTTVKGHLMQPTDLCNAAAALGIISPQMLSSCSDDPTRAPLQPESGEAVSFSSLDHPT